MVRLRWLLRLIIRGGDELGMDLDGSSSLGKKVLVMRDSMSSWFNRNKFVRFWLVRLLRVLLGVGDSVIDDSDDELFIF